QLTSDQLRMLRAVDGDSVDGTSPKPQLERPTRARRPSDELTRTREPLDLGGDDDLSGDYQAALDTPTEDTRLIAPRQRTPVPGTAATARGGTGAEAAQGPAASGTGPPPDGAAPDPHEPAARADAGADGSTDPVDAAAADDAAAAADAAATDAAAAADDA